jgi:hypothetical protein
LDFHILIVLPEYFYLAHLVINQSGKALDKCGFAAPSPADYSDFLFFPKDQIDVSENETQIWLVLGAYIIDFQGEILILILRVKCHQLILVI